MTSPSHEVDSSAGPEWNLDDKLKTLLKQVRATTSLPICPCFWPRVEAKRFVLSPRFSLFSDACF